MSDSGDRQILGGDFFQIVEGYFLDDLDKNFISTVYQLLTIPSFTGVLSSNSARVYNM